jgi:hypothetical protein
MRRTLIALAAVIAAIGPAAASGGLGCEAEDQSLKFAAESGVSRGMGGAFFNLKASLDIAMEGVPDDLKALTLDEALVHSWLDGDELKLQFYVERQEGDFASVDFVVETAMVEEGEYRGGYALTIFAARPGEPEAETRVVAGEVVCFVE